MLIRVILSGLLFVLQGYEFDVGIHYVGGMNGPSITRTLCDQITEGLSSLFHFPQVFNS